MKYELLSPAGDMDKLKTAVHFGADAVYFSGKQFGLRAFSGNFSDEEIIEATKILHEAGKRAYVTLNVFARNNDFNGLAKHIKLLVKAEVDAVIVSDLGVFAFVKKIAPKMEIHVSTQSNITNIESAKMWASLGAKRLVLARELSREEIIEIAKAVPKDVEIECFVHGAMCISYSGRCLLSNYLTGRDSNHGECAQACRWNYALVEQKRPDEKYEICENERGSYILNSKDLCLVGHLKEMMDSGIKSFKIEGRMKSIFYVATVTNAYRRMIDAIEANSLTKTFLDKMQHELNMSSHREFTTGFFAPDHKIKQDTKNGDSIQESTFVAVVTEVNGNIVTVQHRNRFCEGDKLNILSSGISFNKNITVTDLHVLKNGVATKTDDAKLVQMIYRFKIPSGVTLFVGDMLRRV